MARNRSVPFHCFCGCRDSSLYGEMNSSVRWRGFEGVLETFTVKLDGALSTLVWWEVSLPVAGRSELDGLQGPFRPKPFCDLMIL